MDISKESLEEIDQASELENTKKVEAALFISGRFLSVQELVALTDVNPIFLKKILEDLSDKINLIRPNVFVVPDEWNDANRTLVNAKSWMINHKPNLPEEVELMAVCQGESLHELMTTYQTLLDLGYKHIAFNHSSCAYFEMYPGMDPLKSQMYGRMEFIRKLVQTGTINKNVYHHLLGCSLPQEFMVYGDWDFIKSCDTSNPILVGAEGIRYTDSGINFKPENKLEHYFEMDL